MPLGSTSLIDEEARRRFESAWCMQRREPIENFLPPQDSPSYLPTLEELVLIEMDLWWKSWQSGKSSSDNGHTVLEPMSLHDYLDRFPALDQPDIVERLRDEEERLRREGRGARDEERERGRPERPSPLVPQPASEPMQLPGYHIEEMLGKGGMGIVYRARQAGLNRVVALKMLLPGAYADAEELARFRDEAEAVARLQHPHIVQIFEVNEHRGQPFFSLEYVDGGSLDSRLHGEPQPAAEAARLVRTLAQAIHAAHERGLVHRDLKPANVLLTRAGVPKITDFGLAKQLDADTGRTRSGAIMGTPSYMAPEQAEGNVKAISPATDVYALGAILYEMLTGRAPFRGASVLETLEQVRTCEPVAPRQLQPGVPRDLETICLKCLHKEPARRYASAAGLAEDLRRFLDGEPIVARPVGSIERSLKWIRRHPVPATLIAVSIFAVLSVVGGYVIYQQQQLNRITAAQVLIADGVAAAEQGSREGLEKALGKFQGALGVVGNITEAAQMRAGIESWIGKTEKRLRDLVSDEREREKRPMLLQIYDTARGLPVSPDSQARLDSPRTIRELAPTGLALFAGSADKLETPILSDTHFGREEQQEIRDACYGLALLLADAIAQPLPGEVTEEQAKKALALLDQAVCLREPTASYHEQRARYFTALNEANAAKRERQLALERERKGTSLLDEFRRGNDQMQQNPEAAAEHFQAALALRPDDFWSRLALGICYLNKRHAQPATAEEAFGACIGVRQDYVWSYLLRGYARTELGRLASNSPDRAKESERHFARAEDDFRQAETLAHERSARFTLAMNRGYLRLLQGQLDEAIADFKQAALLQPDEAGPREFLASAYASAGQLNDALQQANDLVADWPEKAGYYRTRARIHLDGDNLAAAKEDLETALQKAVASDPLRAEDYKELGSIFARQKQFAEAVSAYDRALALQGPFPVAHRLRAEALIELQRYREALVSLDEYFKVVGGNIDAFRKSKEPVAKAYRNRALALARVQHPAAALEDYARALALEEDAATYAARGWIYVVTDSPRLAARDFEAALRLDATNGDAFAGRGHARVLLGDQRSATMDAELALHHGPRTPRLVYNCARIYAMAATKTESERQFQERTVALIREALKLLPADERQRFWKEFILTDSALAGVRRTPTFVRLAQEMSTGPQERTSQTEGSP